MKKHTTNRSKLLTGEAIIGMPRAKVPAVKLPPEGLFFGSASYGGKNNPGTLALSYTGHAHCRWVGDHPTPSDEIQLKASALAKLSGLTISEELRAIVRIFSPSSKTIRGESQEDWPIKATFPSFEIAG